MHTGLKGRSPRHNWLGTKCRQPLVKWHDTVLELELEMGLVPELEKVQASAMDLVMVLGAAAEVVVSAGDCPHTPETCNLC